MVDPDKGSEDVSFVSLSVDLLLQLGGRKARINKRPESLLGINIKKKSWLKNNMEKQITVFFV